MKLPGLSRITARHILIAILLFAAMTRFWRLSFPPQYYFDEVYHVVTAKLMAHNDPRAYEWWHPAPEPQTAIDWLHPPLAKLTQAFAMTIVGENSFGWRLSSAVFGVGVIGLTYALGKKLRFSPSVSLLAAGLASLDGLLLTMSRITMNDIHVTFFILLTLWCYLHWREQPTWRRAIVVGAAAGAAAASKWSGIFVVAPIVFNQLWLLFTQKIQQKSLPWRPTAQIGLAVASLIPLVYLASYGQMFLQGHSWHHFWELHQQIWWYQTNLTATHPYQSTPVQWLLDLRPVYTFTQSAGAGAMQNMYIQGNPLLLWGGLAAVLWTLSSFLVWAGTWFQLSFNALEARSKKAKAQYRQDQLEWHTATLDSGALLLVTISYLSMWIVWLDSPRIMFFYHYTPAIPFLCLILSYWLVSLARQSTLRKWLVVGYVGLVALTFTLFYPNWTGLAVPAQPLSSLYFALSSWR